MKTRHLEKLLGDRLRRHFPAQISAFALFIAKLGWAALFGGLLLLGILITKVMWPADAALTRYDALTLYAIALQSLMIILRLETWPEMRVILLFHVTGTIMELFKTKMGSWTYPEPSLLRIDTVPLFSGFMYAAVGSFMTRAIHVFDMSFTPFPHIGWLYALGIAIYINFFTHNYFLDLRNLLFLASLFIFWRTRIFFRIEAGWYWIPLPIAALLSSFFLWVAENIGTLTRTWFYAGQSNGDLVSLSKLGSWYLLLYISFASVLLVNRDAIKKKAPKGPFIFCLEISRGYGGSAPTQFT